MNMIHLINESFAWLGVCVCVWVCTRAKLAENRNYCPFEVNVFIIRAESHIDGGTSDFCFLFQSKDGATGGWAEENKPSED